MVALIDEFKAFFRNLHQADLNGLEALYTPNIIFKDPVQEIRGRAQLQDYTASLCTNVTECRFEYLDELIAERSAYIKWIMHYRHPKLGKGLISVRGMTHVQFDEKGIYFHEDSYDLGALVYEQLPLLGVITRWLKRRMI